VYVCRGSGIRGQCLGCAVYACLCVEVEALKFICVEVENVWCICCCMYVCSGWRLRVNRLDGPV